MKVNSAAPIFFRGKNEPKKLEKTPNISNPTIKELPPVIPDFAVVVPTKYTKLGVDKLNNGLEIHKYKLANGHKITIVPMEGSPAVVKNFVNVGSLNETPEIKGISHFLEHMAFNGTNGEDGRLKLEVGDSFKKIDELGGWANASTNYAITDYVNSTPLLNEGDLEKQIKVIASMTEDLTLSEKMIEKEKGPVCSEINMILDSPETIAIDQTVRTLFNIKNSTDEMVGGSVKHIKNLTQKDVKDYYEKYYTPDNMNLVITGDVNPEEAMQIVAMNFNSKKVSNGKKFEEPINPIQKTVRKDFVSDKATSTDIVLGFAGPKNNDIREKIIYDIAERFLWSYSTDLESNLKKYNAYPFIDSDKISTNPNANRLVYLATSCSDENTEKVLRGIFTTLSNLPSLTEERLSEIKKSLKIERENRLQYSSEVNNAIGNSVLNNTLEHFVDYEKILDTITPAEVDSSLKKYFNINKAAITVVHPKKDTEITFKAQKRQPIKNENVSLYKLSNNYKTGFYKTQSNNLNIGIKYTALTPYNKKAGVVEVLNEIYSMGFAENDENEFQKLQEKNNIGLDVYLTQYGMRFNGRSSCEDRQALLDNIEKVINEPRLTEENLEIAKNRIKDFYSRYSQNAYHLYANYDNNFNKYEFTESEILSNLDNITIDDLKECQQYLLRNSRATVVANLPEENEKVVKSDVLKTISKFSTVKPNIANEIKFYTPTQKPVVLIDEHNNSQADILQVYKFKNDGSLKTKAVGSIMNSILSNSSIGLFDVLREKEQLAYSVHSSISSFGDEGEVHLNILTTTDNKEIEEYSYDNVQKSIKGFEKQIKALKLGDFTDKDLANAKLIIKAKLINNEGNSSKLANLQSGMNSKHGVNYINKLFDEIDSVTKNDVITFAQNVFANHPIYSIVATKDTLEYNQEFLKTLGDIETSK